MKKVVLILLCLITFALSKEIYATKDDIQSVKEDIKALAIQMDKRFEQMQHYMDKRFEQMQHYMDKRFEQVDKRFEDMNKRFEQVDKRFEDMNKRFEDINKRFEDMNKRFEQVDKRFEDMNKRFDEQMSFLYIITSIFTTFTVTVLGFAFWDRATTIKRAKEEALSAIEDELNKKADINKLEKLVVIIEEFAKKDEKFRKILEKHHLKYAI